MAIGKRCRYNDPMKYSLRSLMLDAVLAMPFLVAGAFVLYCAREALQICEDMRFCNGIVVYDGTGDPYEKPKSP